jgi:hypothetical protein
MSCESGYGTESCAAQEPSERHRIGRGELNEFEAVRAHGIWLSQWNKYRTADRAFDIRDSSFFRGGIKPARLAFQAM